MKNIKKRKVSLVFIGTPDFGIPALRALIKNKNFDLKAVITQPDKTVGRKQIITPPPIKLEARKNNILIWQPAKITDFKFPISKLDIIVVAAYGQIIPRNILNFSKYGCVNIHGSLLPKYRGASCVQAAIINGDKQTGATIMKMDKGLDTGPILSQKTIAIKASDTAGTLYSKLSNLGAELLIPTLTAYIDGRVKARPQDNSKASYVKVLKKKDGLIDWENPAKKIERFIRAMAPWPGAFTNIQNQKSTIKIIKTKNKILDLNEYKSGELFLRNDNLAIQCGQGALIIEKLQPEGKKILSSKEFINGYSGFIKKNLH